MPEFLNRVDETIIFDRLTENNSREIVKLQIARVMKRIEAQGLTLELSDAALTHLAREGYDPAYGARPLKRGMQKQVLDPLSRKLLDGTYHDGDKITVDSNGVGLDTRG